MEPSNSLKTKAEEAIANGESSFTKGKVHYTISNILPKQNVSFFFVVTSEGKNYFVYTLRDATTSA